MLTKIIQGRITFQGTLDLPLSEGASGLGFTLDYTAPDLDSDTRSFAGTVVLTPDMTVEELLTEALDVASVAMAQGRNAPDEHTVERPAQVVDRTRFVARAVGGGR